MKTRIRNSLTALLVSLAALQMHAQQRINGTVSDETGQPVSGAIVMETGTSNATVTDTDGSYLITTKSSSPELLFTCIGYINVTAAWSGQARLDIIMSEDVQLMLS